MRPILPTPTSSASVHPSTPLATPSLGSATLSSTPLNLPGDGVLQGGRVERQDRSRWFHRVGDFFLGTPSPGDNQVTTTEETPEEPIIRWICAFEFKRGEDNEALVADGWRWRMQWFFVSQVFGALTSLVAILGVPRRANTLALTFALAFWFALAATATVLAFFQNTSCLRRSTAATMLHVILHLALLAVCVCALLVDADLGAVLSSPNASSVSGGGALSSLSSNTTVVVISFDAWIRREIALSLCLASYFFALLLPVSRGGRWLGIVFQVTAVPAIQVRGVASGVGAGRASGWLD